MVMELKTCSFKKRIDIMKLFTIGPTEMFETTKNIRKKEIPYFRTDSFSNDMLEIDTLLKKTIGTKNDSKTVYLTASGTAAMEATVINCFDRNDRLLVIAGGTFGNRFDEICTLYQIPHDVIRLDNNEKLEKKHFDRYESVNYTALLVNLHETSTGQLYDINLLNSFCKRKKMFLIVDAISTFLCDSYKMDEWGISATIISTQKGLCVTPGMSMVVISDELVQRILNRDRVSLYFDFRDYFKNMDRGQTPFTPAVGIVYEVLDMLRNISSQGLDNKLNYIEKMANVYRENVCGNGISIPDFKMSNAITTTHFEKPLANSIYSILKDKYDMCVNPSGGEFGKYNFRVSHVGNLKERDFINLANAIKKLYHELENEHLETI